MKRKWAAAAACVVLLAGCGGGGGNDQELASATGDKAEQCKELMKKALDAAIDAMDLSKGVDAAQSAFEDAIDKAGKAEDAKVCDELDADTQDRLADELQPEYEAKIKERMEKIAGGVMDKMTGGSTGSGDVTGDVTGDVSGDVGETADHLPVGASEG